MAGPGLPPARGGLRELKKDAYMPHLPLSLGGAGAALVPTGDAWSLEKCL